MSERPLNGQRVLVSRPAHQAQGQQQQLAARGALAVPLPLLTIAPLSAPDPRLEHAKGRILDLDLYQSVIFVSANAARYGAEWIDAYWPQLPVRVNFLAVGRKTAATLRDYGIDACHSPIGYDSEALLQSPRLQQVENARILIIRGVGGRDALAAELEARGARVEYAELYQRCRPDYSDAVISSTLYNPVPDALLITSGEGLHNLLALAEGSRKQFAVAALKHSHLVVPSERIRQLAEAAGFTRITTAAGPDDESMVDALLPENYAEIDT